MLVFDTNDQYETYYKEKTKTGITQEEISSMSPDNIDVAAFWKDITGKFYSSIGPKIGWELKNQGDVNHVNYGLAINSGALVALQSLIYFDNGGNLLEIGPGYGYLKSVFGNCGIFNYHAIDVCPQFDGVVQCDGYTIPSCLKNKKYKLVISINVFQHLSVKQRRSYYKEALEVLEDNGRFTVTHQLGDNAKGYKCEEDGRCYLGHYGQYTLLQTSEEISKDLYNAGFKITHYFFREDGFTVFHCWKPSQSSNMSGANDAI